MQGDLNSYSDLATFPQPLRDRVRELAEHQFFIQGEHQSLEIENLNSGCADPAARTSKVDRFKIKWMHATFGSVSWWLIFDATNPSFPPDFILHDANFVPSIRQLPSLLSWDVDEPNALVNVVEDLLRAQQMNELKNASENLFRMYEALLKLNCVDPAFCSAHLLKSRNSAEFWFRLLFDRDPRQYADIFCRQGNVTSDLRINLSPAMKNTVGEVTFNAGMTSVDRLAGDIHEFLTGQLEEEKKSIDLRRALVVAVLTLQGESVVETDTLFFHSVDLLMQFKQVFVQVSIKIPPRYLCGRNVIQLKARDVYHMEREHSSTLHAKECPLQTASEILDMTEKLTDKIGDAIAHRYLIFRQRGAFQAS